MERTTAANIQSPTKDTDTKMGRTAEEELGVRSIDRFKAACKAFAEFMENSQPLNGRRVSDGMVALRDEKVGRELFENAYQGDFGALVHVRDAEKREKAKVSLEKLNEFGENLIYLMMGAVKEHSYETTGGDAELLGKIADRFGFTDDATGEYRSVIDMVKESIDSDARELKIDGFVRRLTSLPWAIAGFDMFANAYRHSLSTGMPGSEALSVSLGSHYSNLPTSIEQKDTIAVSLEDINDLTKFSLRHAYKLFGSTSTLRVKDGMGPYLPSFIRAIERGDCPLFTSVIERVSPDFFEKDDNGVIKAYHKVVDEVVRIFDSAIESVCSNGLKSAVETRSELIDAVSSADIDDTSMNLILTKVLGYRNPETYGPSMVTLSTPDGDADLIDAQVEGMTTGSSSINRGTREGAVRATGIASSKRIVNKGVTRGESGEDAFAELEVYGTDYRVPLNTWDDLDNFTVPVVLRRAFNNEPGLAYVACRGLMPFTYIVDGGVQQDTALISPSTPADDATNRMAPNPSIRGFDTRGMRFDNTVAKISDTKPDFSLTEDMRDKVISGIETSVNAADEDGQSATNVTKGTIESAAGVLERVLSAYKQFRRDVRAAYGLEQKAGRPLITTGNFLGVVNLVSQSLIIDMLNGSGDEFTIRERTLQDVKSALVSRWAHGAGISIKQQEYAAEDDKLSEIAAYLYGNGGIAQIARHIVNAYMDDARLSGKSMEDASAAFNDGVGLEKYSMDINKLLNAHVFVARLVGRKNYPIDVFNSWRLAARGDLRKQAAVIRGSAQYDPDGNSMNRICDAIYAGARKSFDEWCLQFSYDELNEDNSTFRNVMDAVNDFYDSISTAMFSTYGAVSGRDAVKDTIQLVKSSIGKSGKPSKTKNLIKDLDHVSDIYTLTQVLNLAKVAVDATPAKPDGWEQSVVNAGANAGRVSSGDGLEELREPDGGMVSIDDADVPATQFDSTMMLSDYIDGHDKTVAENYGILDLAELVQRDDTNADVVKKAILLYDDARTKLAEIDQLNVSNFNGNIQDVITDSDVSTVMAKTVTILGNALCTNERSLIGRFVDNAIQYIERVASLYMTKPLAILANAIKSNVDVVDSAGTVTAAKVAVCKIISSIDATAFDDITTQPGLTGVRAPKKSVVRLPKYTKDNTRSVAEVESPADGDDIVDSYSRLILSPSGNDPYRQDGNASTKLSATQGVHDSMIAYNSAMMHRIATDKMMRDLASTVGKIIGITPSERENADAEYANRLLRNNAGTSVIKAFTGIAGDGIGRVIVNDIIDDERQSSQKTPEYDKTISTIKSVLDGNKVAVYAKNLTPNELSPESEGETGDYNTKGGVRKFFVAPDGSLSDEPSEPMDMNTLATLCGISGDFPTETSGYPSHDTMLRFIGQLKSDIARKMIDYAVNHKYSNSTRGISPTLSPEAQVAEIEQAMLPHIEDGTLKLAELVFVMNRDVEGYAVQYQSTHNRENTPVPKSSDVLDARREGIMSVMKGLPIDIGEDELIKLATRYFTSVGERDEISHSNPDVAAVFEKLTGNDLIDRDNALRDISPIIREFIKNRIDSTLTDMNVIVHQQDKDPVVLRDMLETYLSGGDVDKETQPLFKEIRPLFDRLIKQLSGSSANLDTITGNERARVKKLVDLLISFDQKYDTEFDTKKNDSAFIPNDNKDRFARMSISSNVHDMVGRVYDSLGKSGVRYMSKTETIHIDGVPFNTGVLMLGDDGMYTASDDADALIQSNSKRSGKPVHLTNDDLATIITKNRDVFDKPGDVKPAFMVAITNWLADVANGYRTRYIGLTRELDRISDTPQNKPKRDAVIDRLRVLDDTVAESHPELLPLMPRLAHEEPKQAEAKEPEPVPEVKSSDADSGADKPEEPTTKTEEDKE